MENERNSLFHGYMVSLFSPPGRGPASDAGGGNNEAMKQCINN